MFLTKYDKSKIDNKNYAQCKLQKIIDEFRNSDMDCAKVENWEHKNAGTCASSFNLSIKRFHIGGIKAISRKGEVFLIKEDVNASTES